MSCTRRLAEERRSKEEDLNAEALRTQGLRVEAGLVVAEEGVPGFVEEAFGAGVGERVRAGRRRSGGGGGKRSGELQGLVNQWRRIFLRCAVHDTGEAEIGHKDLRSRSFAGVP